MLLMLWWSRLRRAVSLKLGPRSLVVDSDFGCCELRARSGPCLRSEKRVLCDRCNQCPTLTASVWHHRRVASASDKWALANVEHRWRFDGGRMAPLATRGGSNDDSALRSSGLPQTMARARAASALPPSQGTLAELLPTRERQDFHRWKLRCDDLSHCGNCAPVPSSRPHPGWLSVQRPPSAASAQAVALSEAPRLNGRVPGARAIDEILAVASWRKGVPSVNCVGAVKALRAGLVGAR